MTATRFWRLVAIPDDLGDRPATVRTGCVMLPNRSAWSGQLECDLDDPRDRAHVYELVMTEGTEDDVRTYIDLDVLLGMRDTMWLAPRGREKWADYLRSRGLIAWRALTPLGPPVARRTAGPRNRHAQRWNRAVTGQPQLQ